MPEKIGSNDFNIEFDPHIPRSSTPSASRPPSQTRRNTSNSGSHIPLSPRNRPAPAPTSDKDDGSETDDELDALGGGRFENIFAYQPPAGDNDASKPDTSSGAKSSAAAADAPGAEELDKLEKEVNEMHRGPYAMYPGPQYPGPHGYPPYAYPGAGMYPPPHHAEHLQRMEQEAHDSMQMQTAHASAMIRMQAQYGLELARAKNELAFAQSTASILKSWGDWFKQFFG